MGSEGFTLLLERINAEKARLQSEAFEALKDPQGYIMSFGKVQGLEAVKTMIEEIQSDSESGKD